jgi:hypothetical protein
MGVAADSAPSDFVAYEEMLQGEPPPEPEDSPDQVFVNDFLSQEEQSALQRRLSRNLLDDIVAVARDQVAAQATSLRYSEDDIKQALVDWWRSDLDIPPTLTRIGIRIALHHSGM